MRASLQRVSSSPHTYQSPYAPVGSVRLSWNHGWSDDVWFMTRSAITRMPALVRLVDEVLEVVDRPVVGVDVEEVRDVVAAVAERRRVEGQQPDAVDAEPLQVVELVGEPAEVAGAVVVPVEEPAQMDLVEDRGLEPQRVAARTSSPASLKTAPTLSMWLLPGGEPDVVPAGAPRERAPRSRSGRRRRAAGRARPGPRRRPRCSENGSTLTTQITSSFA